MRKIGIYGGTFDPIHFGHLAFASAVLDQGLVEEVWFVPVFVSPFKQDSAPTAADHRLKMVELATVDFPRTKVLDLEVRREGPSYTIDTLRDLKSQHDAEFSFLLADEVLATLPDWKEVDEILDKASLIVGRRSCTRAAELDRPARVTYVEMPIVEFSATDARSRLKNGLYCGHMVPGPVLEYIIQMGLYRCQA